MDLFNQLTPTDKNKINNYIDSYVDGRGARATLDHLMRFWSDHKENLYHLFGDKFIISKEIVYEKPLASIETEIRDNILHNTEYSFSSSLKDKLYFLYSDSHLISYDTYEALINLITNSKDFATNNFNGKSFNFTLNDRKIMVQHGCKPMRILGKIAKELDLEDEFEKFRIAVSMATNQKTLKGELCLSIHPLDFMTMSDNNCGWSSCMSWGDDGCYKRGTVEMMNSKNVVVAYLKSADKSDIGPIKWNSKKWRTLLIVDPDMIVSVKAYPYQNTTLAQEALKMIQELEPEQYGPIKELPFDDDFDYEGHKAYYITTTDAMYNDFGRDVTHYGAFSKALMEHPVIDLNVCYSGESECMWCGSSCEDFESESDLVCEDCCNYEYCDQCGDRIYDGDSYEVDGQLLCNYCYEHNASYDPITEEDHLDDNMETLYLVPSKYEGTELTEDIITNYSVLSTYCDVLNYPESYKRTLEQYITDHHIHKFSQDYHYAYYIFSNQLTEDGMQLFGYRDATEMEKDLANYEV